MFVEQGPAEKLRMGHLENTGIPFRYGAGGSWNLFPRIVVGPNEQAYHIKILLADRGQIQIGCLWYAYDSHRYLAHLPPVWIAVAGCGQQTDRQST